MLFNSFSFLIFFLIFFILYWFVCNRSYKSQNVLTIIGGCLFYGWWDWRFLFLLAFSTVLGFVAASYIHKESSVKRRKRILAITIIINIALLFFFKYFNFFIQSWVDLMALFDIRSDVRTLQIILPIGISFYTFQKLSYVIDVYNKRVEPTQSFMQFAAYVSFFPQLLAGPIERATTLLPQFGKRRTFNAQQGIGGMEQILYGLFKKIVVADNCAMFVNMIWQQHESLSGIVLVVGAVFFAFQIYGDFSGYTDIARGCAKLLGFELMVNFRYPYLSRSITEFWRRWHISLSSWFRDYVYVPLGGSRNGKWKTIRNVFIIFVLSGIWHGANWTFVIWGLINAFFFLPGIIFRKTPETEVVAQHTKFPALRELLQIGFTFAIVCFGWVFFRSDSVMQAFNFLKNCMSPNMSLGWFFSTNTYLITFIIACLAIIQLTAIDFYNRRNELVNFKGSIIPCVILFLEIGLLGSYKNHFEFIYFQF